MCALAESLVTMSKLNYLISLSVLLTACAHTSPPAPSAAPAVQAAAPVTPVAPPPPPLPDVELTEDLLFQLLVSEVAVQRGYADLGFEGMWRAAQQTRDPRLARRASQLALESGNLKRGVEVFRLWEELDPNSAIPARLLSSLLLRDGKLDEAAVHFAKVLQQDPDSVPQLMLQIETVVEGYADKAAGLKLMRKLAEPYPAVAEAHWAVARMARQAGDSELAMQRVQQARQLRPDWSRALVLEAQLTPKSRQAEMLVRLQSFLNEHADARDVRLQYARMLLEEKRYPQARAEFQRLSDASPENGELAFAVALIALQMGDIAGAEAQLRNSSALSQNQKDSNTVQFYLGQLHEANKDNEEALRHYRLVKSGEFLFKAQLRMVFLLNKMGRLTEARQQLHQINVTEQERRVQVVLAEAQLLREAGKHAEAYQVVQQALNKTPNDPDLLYEGGLLADRAGLYEVAEKLFRKLIELQPERAHAYNALGFSLLERNIRIPEAVALVEKASQLAPEDVAIMDSVGWAHYRSGRLEDSIKWLRRAFAANPDPEIASHLGEALWVHGEQDEARKIWRDSLKANPGNALLEAVIKKFNP